MLVSRLGDHVGKHVLSFLQILLLHRAQPSDECLSLKTMGSSEANGLEEVILCVPRLSIVSPPAQIVSQRHVLISDGHSLYDLGACYLVGENPLSIQVDLPPEEEELLFVVMVNIAINQAVSLVVLVNNIEGLPVPGAERRPLPILNVIAQDSEQLGGLAL